MLTKTKREPSTFDCCRKLGNYLGPHSNNGPDLLGLLHLVELPTEEDVGNVELSADARKLGAAIPPSPISTYNDPSFLCHFRNPFIVRSSLRVKIKHMRNSRLFRKYGKKAGETLHEGLPKILIEEQFERRSHAVVLPCRKS